jgi:hypothetical protein
MYTIGCETEVCFWRTDLGRAAAIRVGRIPKSRVSLLHLCGRSRCNESFSQCFEAVGAGVGAAGVCHGNKEPVEGWVLGAGVGAAVAAPEPSWARHWARN